MFGFKKLKEKKQRNPEVGPTSDIVLVYIVQQRRMKKKKKKVDANGGKEKNRHNLKLKPLKKDK